MQSEQSYKSPTPLFAICTKYKLEVNNLPKLLNFDWEQAAAQIPLHLLLSTSACLSNYTKRWWTIISPNGKSLSRLSCFQQREKFEPLETTNSYQYLPIKIIPANRARLASPRHNLSANGVGRFCSQLTVVPFFCHPSDLASKAYAGAVP